MDYGSTGVRRFPLGDFTNDYGEKITIREDGETKYPDGGLQMPHFNAGPT